MIIMKFGGASTSNAEGVRGVSKIVAANRDRRPVVVVSAMGKTTRALDRAARQALAGKLTDARAECVALIDSHVHLAVEVLDGSNAECVKRRIGEIGERLSTLIDGIAIVRELSPRTLDACLSLGELLASAILSYAVEASHYVPAASLFITNDNFTKALPDARQLQTRCAQHITPLIEAGNIVLTEGYVGATIEGVPTTMGMESSDYSATLLGEALSADEVQVWTNVDGIMTVDPRVSPLARTIPALTYDEAEELAALGAKILHPRTIGPARSAGVPLTVRNSGNPTGAFTLIHDDRNARIGVKAITVADHVYPDRANVNPDEPGHAEYEFTVRAANRKREWKGFGDRIMSVEGSAAISLVGNGIGRDASILQTIIDCVGGATIEGMIVGASRLSMSVIVNSQSAQGIVERLHSRLFS